VWPAYMEYVVRHTDWTKEDHINKVREAFKNATSLMTESI